MTTERTVKTFCNLCTYNCGIDVTVKDGRITKVAAAQEHPLNRLCIKNQGLIEWVYSPERITTPMMKIRDEWKEVGWDEALGFISDKLSSIRKDYGAKSLVVHTGFPFINTHVARAAARFCSVYGTPNFTSGGSFCFCAQGIGHGLTFSSFMSPALSNYDDTRCIVIWGNNPASSDVAKMASISTARKEGARLIVIDPRATSLAKGADIFVQIRPGTDTALALGLLNVIIKEELYDKEFVAKWTVGFDRLVEHVKEYSPDRVAEITWVPIEKIRDIARVYAGSKPATISQGVPIDHSINGIQASRAIASLIAITGNIDVFGGNVFSPPLRQKSIRVKGKVSVDEAIGIEYPIFSRFTSEVTASTVTEAILSGKPYQPNALIFQGVNPVLTWPNSGEVKKALKNLELLVVIDLFMTDTAKLAHVFLPATTFLEEKVLKDYSSSGLSLIGLGNRAIDPVGNSMEDWKIWAEIARTMGDGEYFPWEDSDALFNDLLQPTGVTMGELEKNTGGIFYRTAEEKKYMKQGFNTPSGKVELFSQTLEQYGYDPLPTFEEPTDSLVRDPQLAEKYPLILTTGARASVFTHSQYRNILSLRKRLPEPLIEINTQTAQDIGINTGDVVIVTSLRGSIKLKAVVTDDIHTKVVSIPHGWSEANANVLTDDKHRDPISGYPNFRSILCKVAKA